MEALEALRALPQIKSKYPTEGESNLEVIRLSSGRVAVQYGGYSGIFSGYKSEPQNEQDNNTCWWQVDRRQYGGIKGMLAGLAFFWLNAKLEEEINLIKKFHGKIATFPDGGRISIRNDLDISHYASWELLDGSQGGILRGSELKEAIIE